MEGKPFVHQYSTLWYMSCLNATSSSSPGCCVGSCAAGKGGGEGTALPCCSFPCLTSSAADWSGGNFENSWSQLQPSKHSDTPRLQQTPFSPKRPRCLPTAAPEACIPRPRTSSRRQVSVPTPHQRQASHALALPRPHHGPRRRAPLELEHSVGDPTPLLPLQPLRHDPVRPSLP